MKKIIKLDFNNTTRERKTEDSYSELYSHDKNNGSFEFEILNDTLTTEQVIALFKFTESNKIWKTSGTVEGNKVNVTFDTTLITQNETVICYLYFDEEQRTSDTFRFKFKVKVSEIDKMSRYEVKERFINNTVIVDRLDVVTKDELKEALKNVGGIATEGLLTEVKAEEIYAKKSEAVDNTNFELVKNRVLALELKTDKDTVYDDSELKGRISVLEAREDNNTIYDDTNVRERLTVLENKPNVDVNNFVTKDELASKNYLTEHQDLSNYALKSEIPTPYNDTPLNERITALENRPTTGGSVDTTNLVTKAELKEKEDDIYDAINRNPLFEVYAEETAKEHLDNSSSFANENIDSRGGIIYSNASHTTADIFKGDVAKEKFVDFNTAMFTVANSIPDNYSLSDLMYAGGEDKKVLFLSNKNFSEVVPKEELKAIIKEVGGTGGNIDTSHFITDEILESKNYLTQHQPLDNLVTKEELNSKGYVTEETLNSKGYLTQHQPLTDYALKSELYNDTEVKERLTTLESRPNVDTSSFVTNEQLENKHYLTQHQELTHLATTSDLEALRNIAVSKSELNNKLDTTEFNSFKDNVVTKTELAEKGYLTTHQDLSEYALKSELYNDSNLQFRIGALEHDVRYNTDSIKRSVEDLEYKLRDYDSKISDLDSKTSDLATKEELNDYVKRTELPAPYDDTDLRNSLYSVENELRNKEYEFNSRFVAKDDLRTLVTEIVSQLKSENN